VRPGVMTRMAAPARPAGAPQAAPLREVG
jgi:hypothetical protein